MYSKDEKLAMFAFLFGRFTRYATGMQFMAGLFQPNFTPNFPMVILYWMYAIKVENMVEEHWITAMEKFVWYKLLRWINPEEFKKYVQECSLSGKEIYVRK